MNRKFLFSLLALICATAGMKAADEARLLRFPATNGTEIVFSYAGDLYKVPINGGEARRLTSHVGYEMFPRFSPDGKTIAFTGQYDGNTEVFTMPSTGGEPLRITYTATNGRDDLGDRMGPNNMVMTWHPDGNQIVYRNRISTGFDGKLYQVDKEGGLSNVIPLPEGGFCSYSPDGKQLAYNRVMREFRTWKYYEGGMADDIWIYNPGNQTVKNITNNKAQDIIPMWIGDDIFFISDRDRTMNIFVYNTKSGQTTKVTNFTEFDVKFPSSHGNTIVFENGGYIYKMDATTRKPEKVRITLTSDNIYARNEIKNGGGYMTSASLSPNGERVVVTARGEVFNLPVEKGVTKNITRTPGAHERNAQWSPDGKSIVYISDETGETELYLQPANGGETVQLTKKNDTYIRSFKWSPDSKKIVYTDRKNRINLLDVSSKQATTIRQDQYSEIRDVNFSPDNNWLAYSRMGDNQYSVIHLYNISTKKEYPVTDKWYASYSPVFSTDGKYLIFSSARDFNPTYSSTEWNHVYNNMDGVYIALLSRDTPSPFMEKDPEVGEASKEDTKKDESKKEDTPKESTPAVTVKFDPDGITDRIVKIAGNGSRFGNFYSDGEKVYYTSRGTTKVYDLKKQKEEDVVTGASMTVVPGSKKALFVRGKELFVTDIPQGKIELKDPVNMSDMRIPIDYRQEWAQIFDEAWRAFRDGFYVENMHGVDWKAMKTKYATLLPYVKTRLDLNYVIGEMIGELNCGHAYINPGELDRPERIQTGMLGAEISRDKSGFFKLEKILPGASWSKDLRSPLTEPGVNAKEGEFIVSIDGIATNTVKDMYQLLVGKANISTELLLNDKPQLAGARKVVIRPLVEEYSLYHYNWVQNNIRKVDEASNGKIGYIYIPDMGVEGLSEFSRYFYPQLDKEGLIIDDRANGGGKCISDGSGTSFT